MTRNGTQTSAPQTLSAAVPKRPVSKSSSSVYTCAQATSESGRAATLSIRRRVDGVQKCRDNLIYALVYTAAETTLTHFWRPRTSSTVHDVSWPAPNQYSTFTLLSAG